jgi:iron complex outermembrane receptor protein
MANHSPFLTATRVHAAVAMCIASCASAWAQQNTNEITITDKLSARVSGFGDVPAQELPFSTTTITNATLQDIGARRVSDALRLDASVSDSYNSPAYWDMLSVRGFTLDNRYNYRREGLPISAETMIPMDNKERIELLKGTSGIQAGTSSPGGLVNYVVKRAPANAEQTIRTMTLSYGEGNNKLAAADLGGRFGHVGEFGYRFNVAYEDLNPYIGNTKGHRNLVALAMDWRISADSKLEWEIEKSHRQQIGVNAYSTLGDPSSNGVLPTPVDGTRNFSRQPWLLPGVFDALTTSVRFKQNLDNGWQWNTQLGAQHLRTDDRLAYAYGLDCYDPIYTNCKSFNPSGSFSIYDFRSENEKRITQALQTELSGNTTIANLKHELIFSLMRQRQLDRMPQTKLDDAEAPVGTANIYDNSYSPTGLSPQLQPSTNRSEYSTELSVKDRIYLTPLTSVWIGLKHTMFNRQSIRTDGNGITHDERSTNTSWIGLTHQLNSTKSVYASYGEGLELSVAPNKTGYANPGAVLPIQKSKQQEIGIKSQHSNHSWQAAWFDIKRPALNNAPFGCYATQLDPCTTQIDGEARHQGLELSGNTSAISQWNLGAGYTWIDAKRQNSTVNTDINGQRPINVPTYILRGIAEYRYKNVPGLRTNLRVAREGERNVTEYGEIKLPAWTTWGTSTHYETRVNQIASTWTLAIENLTDKRYWRESPMQYGHYYLYPGAPRTLRATVQFRM